MLPAHIVAKVVFKMSKGTTRKVYKDARTGHFISKQEAKTRPDTTYSQTIKIAKK